MVSQIRGGKRTPLSLHCLAQVLTMDVSLSFPFSQREYFVYVYLLTISVDIFTPGFLPEKLFTYSKVSILTH